MYEDKRFMHEALKEARRAAAQGEVPVGAVIVSGREVLARGYNQSIKKHDPSAHAEVVAIRKACTKQKNYRLEDCSIYVTLEPCAMCMGAVVQARIKRLVFGALDPKAGAVLSIMIFPVEKTNHRMEILGGVLAEESSQTLKDFFKRQRIRQS